VTWAAKGAFDQANTAFGMAIKLGFTYAYYCRGLVHEMKAEYEKGLGDYCPAFRLGPHSTEHQLVIELGRTGSFKSLMSITRAMPLLANIQWQETLLEVQSDIARVTVRQASPCLVDGPFEKAIADFTKALDREPKRQVRLERARAYCVIGRFKEAITDLSEVVSLNAAHVQFILGNCYRENGEWDRAIAALSAAIRLDPKNWGAYLTRGIVHEKKGNNDKAIADYTQAIGLEAKMAPLYRFRAEVFRISGDVAKATDDERRAQELCQ
jgi:tetratricopeptide (TPR) repeat protein